jgi:uncharacterized membrane protein
MLREKTSVRRAPAFADSPLRHAAVVLLIFAAALAAAFGFSAAVNRRSGLPEAVLRHRSTVHRAAVENHIGGYEGWLLSIIQVETGGEAEDVMQSSESEGLRPDSLDTEASVRQGCAYFAGLLERAGEKGADFDTVLQAYNYGAGYIDYVAENGGKNSFALAEAFAAEKSGGKKTDYANPVAADNGGWRYAYGNMYYAILVNQAHELHLEGRRMSGFSRILSTAAALECMLIMLLETFMTSSALTSRIFQIRTSELRRRNLGLFFRNQGVYNGLIGLFLLYGAWISRNGAEVCAIFLAFMTACALYGAVSSGRKIILPAQGLLPAAALLSLLFR